MQGLRTTITKDLSHEFAKLQGLAFRGEITQAEHEERHEILMAEVRAEYLSILDAQTLRWFNTYKNAK